LSNVKPKLLFLAKVLLCSTGLFLIWHPVSQGYLIILKRLVSLTASSYELSEKGDLLIYQMSLYMIPLLALMIITPNVPLMKRAGIAGIGIIVFLVLDITYIQYLIQAEGAAESSQNAVDVLFHSLKLLLPLLLWIIASPAYFKLQAE
jgi:hypothetical protein